MDHQLPPDQVKKKEGRREERRERKRKLAGFGMSPHWSHNRRLQGLRKGCSWPVVEHPASAVGKRKALVRSGLLPALPPSPGRLLLPGSQLGSTRANHRVHLRLRAAHLEGGAAFFSRHSELIKENKLREPEGAGHRALGEGCFGCGRLRGPRRQVEVGTRGPQHPPPRGA